MPLQLFIDSFQPGGVPYKVLWNGPCMPENTYEIRFCLETKNVLKIGPDLADQLLIRQQGQFGCPGATHHGAQQDRILRCPPGKYVGIDDGTQYCALFF